MKSWPRPAYLVMGISALVLIVTPIWFVAAGLGSSQAQNSSVNVGQSRQEAERESSETIQQSARQSGPSTAPGSISRIGTVVEQNERPTGPAPRSLSIPDLGVTARVIPVGVDKDKQVAIPEDISQVGWYRFGATPGTGVGSSVIVGHRDGRNNGIGAFYDLESLRPGDPLVLTNKDGEDLRYEVTGVESITKSKLPFEELFRETGEEALTLISCIGYYQPGVGYEQNIIVSATPSGGPKSQSDGS